MLSSEEKYRDKHYDLVKGRFLQIDQDVGATLKPISHINKYIYVNNSPANLIDPSGKSAIKDAWNMVWNTVKFAFPAVFFF